MHSEFGSGDQHACGTLPFQRGADLAVELRRGANGAVRSYNTWRKSACRNEYDCSATSLPCSSARIHEPPLLAREFVACLADRRRVALQRLRDRADAELDPANGSRGEQRALFAPQLRDVMIDDVRQILWHRHIRELRPGSSVLTALRSTRQDVVQNRRHEERHAVRARVQRTHERFVAGE